MASAAEQGARRAWFLFHVYSFWFFLVWAVGLSVFCLVVFACSFDLFFGCVLLLFLSVLFLVSFHFAFPCLYLSCLLLIVLYRWYPFRNMTAKSAAVLRCRLLPVPIDYWFDIGPIAVWNGNKAVPEKSDE